MSVTLKNLVKSDYTWNWVLCLLFTTSWLKTQVLYNMSFLKHNPTHLLSTHLDMWLNSSFPSVYPETVSYFKGENGKSYILFLSRFYKLFFFFFYLCPQDIIKCKNKQSEFLCCRESQQGGWRVWAIGMSACRGRGAVSGSLKHRPSMNLQNKRRFLSRKEMKFEHRK